MEGLVGLPRCARCMKDTRDNCMNPKKLGARKIVSLVIPLKCNGSTSSSSATRFTELAEDVINLLLDIDHRALVAHACYFEKLLPAMRDHGLEVDVGVVVVVGGRFECGICGAGRSLRTKNQTGQRTDAAHSTWSSHW
ncbi:hypothetical protein N7524_007128 [Penicillium chrysogenum]|jgi:hypothetical protein|nr:hypothetical protein N7524_007128 [Penicillium chrysogenum]